VGFNLVTYQGFVKSEEAQPKVLTEDQKLEFSHSEGAYTFKLKQNTTGENFAQFDENSVSLQSGKYVDQYTVFYQNNKTGDFAIVTIRFAPELFSELIQYSVETSPLEIHEGPKDLSVQWKAYDFDPKGFF
jgi:hypothetical protein